VYVTFLLAYLFITAIKKLNYSVIPKITVHATNTLHYALHVVYSKITSL
jgi:hypothetical protein